MDGKESRMNGRRTCGRDLFNPSGVGGSGIPWPPGGARGYGGTTFSGLMVEKDDGKKEDESYGMRPQILMDNRKKVLKLQGWKRKSDGWDVACGGQYGWADGILNLQGFENLEGLIGLAAEGLKKHLSCLVLSCLVLSYLVICYHVIW